MATEYPADFISLSVPSRQTDVQRFSMTLWKLEVNWKTVQDLDWCFQWLALRAALTVTVATKATVGINTHNGHVTNRSRAPVRPAKQARQSPNKTHFTVSSQSDSVTHWLEIILHTSLKTYPKAWEKTCGSNVFQDNCGQMCLSMLQVRRVAGLFKGKIMWREESDQ